MLCENHASYLFNKSLSLLWFFTCLFDFLIIEGQNKVTSFGHHILPPQFLADPICPPNCSIFTGEIFARKILWTHPKKAKCWQIYSILRQHLVMILETPPFCLFSTTTETPPPNWFYLSWLELTNSDLTWPVPLLELSRLDLSHVYIYIVCNIYA